MKKLQAYKFQLMTQAAQEEIMRRFAGCCRLVWNKALDLENEAYAKEGKHIGYSSLCHLLCEWKKQEKTKFLAEAHSQILQQSLKDLKTAFDRFFNPEIESGYPNFKRKHKHDSFRYPQGFKLDEGNSRIFLPKIGWVRYRKSYEIDGTPKNITVSRSIDKWYISIQTEQEIADPIPRLENPVGIDMGVARFATLSDGTYIMPINSFRTHEEKLARLQRKLSRKVKFSSNWKKTQRKIAREHQKIANCRKDFLHKASTTISKNHAFVVIEDLKVQNMSHSASGTKDKPGKNVQAKSGLNKSILDQGWYEFRRQLLYKLQWRGGTLLAVPPQYTSQRCSQCGNVDKNNRQTQEKFKCTSCGFETNADYNAALNILAAGQAALACGAEKAQASALKQEPSSCCAARKRRLH